MRRLLLIITILLILYCDRESKEKAYLPKMEFNHKENPNYSHYFPGKSDSGNNNSQSGNVDETISAEPVPSFPFQPISNHLEEQKKSSGFFSFLFNDSEDENKKKQSMCEEILDINKIVVADQSQKLKVLNIENDNLLDQINSLERELRQVKRNDQERLRGLESEINKLNGLIKILSTEIK
jgi:hypothetical protein